jgi:hypothetical protein
MSASVTGSGVVGEERVVAPDREQGVLGVGVEHAAHDEPGGDGVAGVGERGVFHFGYLGIGDQFAGVGVGDRAGVVHRCVGLVGDGRDRGVDRLVLGQGEREPGAGFDDGGDHFAVAVGGVAAHEDVVGVGADGFGGVDRLGEHAGGALGGAGASRPQPDSGHYGRRCPGGDRGRERGQAPAQDGLARDLRMSE